MLKKSVVIRFCAPSVLLLLLIVSSALADLAKTPFIWNGPGMSMDVAISTVSETTDISSPHRHLVDSLTPDEIKCAKNQAIELRKILAIQKYQTWFELMGLNQVTIELDEKSLSSATPAYLIFDQSNGATHLTVMIQRATENADSTLISTYEQIEHHLTADLNELITKDQNRNAEGVNALKEALEHFPENTMPQILNPTSKSTD